MHNHTLIISDTSPLYYLEQLRLIELLPKLYGEVVVPAAVVTELNAGAKLGERIPDLSSLSWIRIMTTSIPDSLDIYEDLGQGELEAIALGLETPGSLLLLDDSFAREIAQLNGLHITGTLGVLLRAKQDGFVSAISPLLLQLRAVRFHLSDKVMRDVLELAGESKGNP